MSNPQKATAPTDKEIRRISDLNRVAGYLDSIKDSPTAGQSGRIIAAKALEILKPHLSLPTPNND